MLAKGRKFEVISQDVCLLRKGRALLGLLLFLETSPQPSLPLESHSSSILVPQAPENSCHNASSCSLRSHLSLSDFRNKGS